MLEGDPAARARASAARLVRAKAPIITLSSTVISVKVRTTWKVRARPARSTRSGGHPACGRTTRLLHGDDDLVRTVPDLPVRHLDHREAGGPERSQPELVGLPVDERRVVLLALHLDDERQTIVAEVDPSDPVLAAGVHLATHRRLARLPEDRFEASLEPALRRDVVVATFVEELT